MHATYLVASQRRASAIRTSVYCFRFMILIKIDAITHTLTTLATFTGANGAHPAADPIADSEGNLCGMNAGKVLVVVGFCRFTAFPYRFYKPLIPV